MKLTLVVRADLGLGRGKIAAQAAHAGVVSALANLGAGLPGLAAGRLTAIPAGTAPSTQILNRADIVRKPRTATTTQRGRVNVLATLSLSIIYCPLNRSWFAREQAAFPVLAPSLRTRHDGFDR
ncbi:MAG: peptidyl-tRNA hydrolase [Streptosporangiaceae bacterium]